VVIGMNERFIGVPGGREQLGTPALLVDLDAFERNVAAMAAQMQKSGLALRPHAKAHKSINVARRQIGAGAIGICCATLGEAEVLGAAGISGLLVTSPVVTPAMIFRLVAMPGEVMVVVEDASNLAALEQAFAGAGRRLPVLVEVDVGQRRTGVVSPQQAVELARQIAASPHLEYRGIQAYWGHLQQMLDFEERGRVVRRQAEIVRAVIAALREAGFAPPIVTGGGTGTALIDAGLGLFTELQPGSYLFMDSTYSRAALWPGGTSPFEISLYVRANVVSVNRADHAVINAGLKSFATDSGLPFAARGAPAGVTYKFMGDEHGALVYGETGNARLALGDGVECVVSHCDPTVNLFDVMHCVRGDRLEDIWRIDARGR
jgi:D-serine deaminase-like pyridoxal phosphate-dependent protein